MPLNDQATAAPYSGDNLPTRDTGLVFAREFGTNVNPDLGDRFDSTDAAEEDPIREVSARLAMLTLNSFNAPETEEPRGSTYVLPEWSTFPFAPLFAPTDLSVIVMYGHILLLNQALVDEPQEQTRVSLVLGPIELIGDVPSVPLVLLSITPGDIGDDTPGLQADSFPDGGEENPVIHGGVETFGMQVYWRITMVGSEAKDTSFAVEASRDGVSWWIISNGFTAGFILRRVGLSITGPIRGALDWVRLYTSVPTASFGQNFNFEPLAPFTGGRLFLP